MIYQVKPEEDGRALRAILRGSMAISYTALKSAKWNGTILLNGETAHVDQRVRAGDTVCFLESKTIPKSLPQPYSLPIQVVWEDAHYSIVNKPAPLPSVCGSKGEQQTLENAWFSRLGEPEDFLFRPVNRLDKGTSGLMVIAHDAASQDRLQRLLHTQAFVRRYLAVTEGIPAQPSGVIDLPIAKEDAASVRRVISAAGKPSRTHYEVLKTSGDRALVRLQLETGRTHQIRVHLAAIGCPICGDFLYGTELAQLPGRFALHSAEIELVHPFIGEKLHMESAPDFADKFGF